MIKPLKEIISGLLKDLSPRQREIIEGRFGLKGHKTTLAALGNKHGLTRERVRQIEKDALGLVRKQISQEKELEKISRAVNSFIKNLGGVRREDIFVTDFRGLVNDNNVTADQISFLFEALGTPEYHMEDNNFYGFWYSDKPTLKKATGLSGKFETMIAKKKEDLITKRNLNLFIEKITKPLKISDFVFSNYLSISKKFDVNPYGDFGLISWEEILPKTIRAKAYLVAKKSGQPLHFKKIAELINDMNFDKRKAHYQTVHNELIKDPRFVLVGRGMYGLTEFGYEHGTAKDVIASTLKKYGPLTSKKIIDLVCKQRLLKENTITINLNNKRYFRKLKDGRFHLVEKA
ncbi:MAG: sigma factor-like helix-turn-helix DNA-binding protein [Candidatus Paceibacterota bacterium]|jgi:hypothetical protein